MIHVRGDSGDCARYTYHNLKVFLKIGRQAFVDTGEDFFAGGFRAPGHGARLILSGPR